METTDAKRGDLRVVSPPGSHVGAKLCLILRRNATWDACEIVLIHPHPELATAADAVVPHELAGTPHPIVVQTDLRGVVWTSQASGQRYGRIADELLDAISSLTTRGAEVPHAGVRTGSRLTGLHDRRWRFKEAEGRALDQLTWECTTHLLSSPPNLASPSSPNTHTPARLPRDHTRGRVTG